MSEGGGKGASSRLLCLAFWTSNHIDRPDRLTTRSSHSSSAIHPRPVQCPSWSKSEHPVLLTPFASSTARADLASPRASCANSRPIRPLPTRRARSAPPSTSEQYTGLVSTRVKSVKEAERSRPPRVAGKATPLSSPSASRPSIPTQCQDPPLPFSVAHKFPWEVLLAICKQADEATLVQLCLVSFGMLELAGPVLYRHVNINLIEEIYLFFICVSLPFVDSDRAASDLES